MNESNAFALTIRSEEEAFSVLQQAFDKPESFQFLTEIRFDGWPSYQVRFKGRDWHGSVPSRVMEPLLDIQRNLHRAYAFVKYSQPNVQRLRTEEREKLEVVVQVNNQSSGYDAPLVQQFTLLAKEALQKMSGPEAVIVVLGVAVIGGGYLSFKAWLAHRERLKQAEYAYQNSESDKKLQLQLSENELKRNEMLIKALADRPVLQMAHEDTQELHNRMLKAMKPGDEIIREEVSLASDKAAELVQRPREKSEEIELAGNYSIVANRTDLASGFRIRLLSEDGESALSADVLHELPDEQQKIIQRAEWKKQMIFLQIRATQLRGSIVDAVVVSAREAVVTPRQDTQLA